MTVRTEQRSISHVLPQPSTQIFSATSRRIYLPSPGTSRARSYYSRMKKKFLLIPLLVLPVGAFAQVTPAAGYTPPNDTPSFKVGATIFTDYTYQESPEITDPDKQTVNLSAFNVGRAYINVTGNLNHYLSFRITPDIVRETNSANATAGSEVLR